MTTTDMRGLYVHVPFCLKKCNYCDFCSFDKVENEERKSYIDSLKAEIASYKKTPKISLNTVFFGGGTPSLLTPLEFSEVYSAISENFDLSGLTEFTIEANPKTITEEKLLTYKRNGVNRISIGLQSIHENELKKLGRIHTLSDFEKSLELVRGAGFNNINVDLMYGIPEQTKKSFNETLDYVLSLDITHISLYGLIVEENTPFGKMGKKLVLPTEDEEVDMYFSAVEKLKSKGFIHYEISNYSKPGFESQHNLIYWRTCEYIGVGLAAHSFFLGERCENPVSFSEYLSKNREQYRTKTKLNEADLAYEYAMLRLRLKEGISLADYKAKFGCDFLSERYDKIKRYENLGLLVFSDDIISLTDKGFYLSNAILSDLL